MEEDMSNTKKIMLFCIPNAGGSAMIYSKWRKYLDDLIELFPVELAGRGKRFKSPFYRNLPEAVDDVFNSMKEYIGEYQYAIFGHSMGSWIAFELCKKIFMLGNKMPVHVFLSGRYPPHIDKLEKIMHKLPDEELIDEIMTIGGTSKELLEDKEIKNYFLQIIRADYKILETYEHSYDSFKFSNDITVLRGKKDILVSSIDLEEWKPYALKNCFIHEFDGGHFFINENIESVTKLINSTLLRHLM